MESYGVTFTGHMAIESIMYVESLLNEIICDLMQKHDKLRFYVGAHGDFYDVAVAAVKRAQQENPSTDSKLVLVFANESDNGGRYDEYSDMVAYPPKKGSYSRCTAASRIRRMIDNSELVIAYVERADGGAYNSLKYAQRCGKQIINLADWMKRP